VHWIEQYKSADTRFHQRAIGKAHEVMIGCFPRDKAKASGNELQWHARQRAMHLTDALPRIILVVAHRNCHMRARGKIDCTETAALHQWCRLHHLRGVDACHAPQALIAIANADIYQFDCGHMVSLIYTMLHWSLDSGLRRNDGVFMRTSLSPSPRRR